MKKNTFMNTSAFVVLVVTIAAYTGYGQGAEKKPAADAAADAVMWAPVDIASRDLYLGPGGQAMQPKLEGSVFVSHQPGGNNLKYRIKDGNGREWIVKIADEAQPEVAATRLLWAIGYRTEVNYLAPKLAISKVGGGRYKNVRLEARPETVKRMDRWSWTKNPFLGKREFSGLQVMMAMFNNWDLKDENNVILHENGAHNYVISDLGASFGKLADKSGTRSGRSVNDPKDYAGSRLVKSVENGMVVLDYKGHADHLIKPVPVEHARWLADLLKQLSDRQIADAFRAANYSDGDAAMFAAAFKARMSELDKAVASAGPVAEN